MKILLFPLMLGLLGCGSKDCRIKLQNDTRGTAHLYLSEDSAFSSPVTLDAAPMDMDTTRVSSGDYYWFVSVDSSSIVVYATTPVPVSIDGDRTLLVRYRDTWGDTASWQ